MAREPQIFAPDQPRPERWIKGDQFFLIIGTDQYVLIVDSDEPPLGLVCTATRKPLCEKEITAYRDRIAKRDKPKGFDPDVIWKAVVDFSSPSGNGRV